MRHYCGAPFLSLVLLLCGNLMAVGNDVPETVEPGLAAVRVIYVIPMRERLEHYLTNELVRWGHYQVTLNPQQADALLTDNTNVDLKGLLADPTKVRPMSTRTRGTAFLIDMKTERVVWSTVKRPSTAFLFFGGSKSARDLAQEIVGQLKKDAKKLKQ